MLLMRIEVLLWHVEPGCKPRPYQWTVAAADTRLRWLLMQAVFTIAFSYQVFPTEY